MNDINAMFQDRPIEDQVISAGLEAFSMGAAGKVTNTLIEKFTNIFDAINSKLLSRENISSLFPRFGDTGQIAAITRSQQIFITKANEVGYIKVAETQVPGIPGLKAPLLKYAEVLSDYHEFGDRVNATLLPTRKLISELVNVEDSLRSMSTIGRFNQLDDLLKYRTKFHADIKTVIGEDNSGDQIAYGRLVSNNTEMSKIFDVRNRLKDVISEKAQSAVMDSIDIIQWAMNDIAAKITDETATNKPNAQVVARLSEALFNTATMVQDYGVYLHRVNQFMQVVDAIAATKIK